MMRAEEGRIHARPNARNGDSCAMAKGLVRYIAGDADRERMHIQAIVDHAIETRSSLFLGRFSTDLLLPESVLQRWKDSRIVLRQYGSRFYVNACPPLAYARRAEVGLEEAEAALRSGKYDTVVLSQVFDVIEEAYVTVRDLQQVLDARPEQVSLVLTGRRAPLEITALCDAVS